MGGAGEMDKCIVDQRIGKFVMLVTGFVDDVRDGCVMYWSNGPLFSVWGGTGFCVQMPMCIEG